MAEKIDSQDIVPKKDVPAAYTSAAPKSSFDVSELIRMLLAAVIVIGVGWFCANIVFSSDPEVKQLKQAAFTVIAGFGSGAIGFAFGVYSSKNNQNS